MIKTSLCHITKIMPVLLALGMAAGCATTQEANGDPDPLEQVNRPSYTFTDTLDRYFIRPVAETYAEHTPEVARTGVTNFFDNLAYINVMLNSFLQGKFDDGFSDLIRIVYNTTFGLGGLVDVGTHIGMETHDEDFGQTLAVWGFDQGSYLFIPLLGPNTMRDAPDLATSTFTNPFFYASAVVALPFTFVNIINTRANLLEETRIRDEAAVDPYVFTREAYLQRRNYLIYDGNPPVEGYDDIFDLENGDEIGEGGDVLLIE